MTTLSSVELEVVFSNPRLIKLDEKNERLAADLQLIYKQNGNIVKQSEACSFIAPIGATEAEAIKSYLEEYHVWPVGIFAEQAKGTENSLPQWGNLLWQSVSSDKTARLVLEIFIQASNTGEAVLSIQVLNQEISAAKAASRLLSLPWELLRYQGRYLFELNFPIRIRRKAALATNNLAVSKSKQIRSLRILSISPRPLQAGYIDHRISIQPLLEGLEPLGKYAEVICVNPPTIQQLKQVLEQAQAEDKFFQVLHFDGHGEFNVKKGKGALCFEHRIDNEKVLPEIIGKVYADEFAALLKQYSIPLVFLEACQTAQSDADPNASMAGALLEAGVSSVIAMSHSVMVETARRFVEAFYQQIAKGQSVGTAMLAGRKNLLENTERFNIIGAGMLHLQDWFVPVLYQQTDDLYLFPQALNKTVYIPPSLPVGYLPKTPKHTFIGRSLDLLKLERLLNLQPYAVLRGQGGIGKTTLAVELARWLVRSGRVDRAAFISVEEGYNRHVRAVVDVLGKQLVGEHYTVAEYPDLKQALQPIQRELENQRVLIVVDNVESLLGDEANLAEVLELLSGLLALPPSPALPPKWEKRVRGGAQIIFTSRESLPEPFAARPITLGALSVRDAKALVLQVMNQDGLQLRTDAQGHEPEQVKALVESVGCHARALVLLARELAKLGLSATTEHIQRIMQALHERHPDQRELSLFASVELSLQRLSPEMREWVKGLALFEGGGNLYTVSEVACNGDAEQAEQLLAELIEVGLAEEQAYTYVRFDPALAPYLKLSLSEEQWQSYQQRWVEVMGELVEYLYEQLFEDARLAFQLTLLELPNLMRYLQQQVQAWQQESVSSDLVLDKLRSVEQLLAQLNQPQALATVVQWRHSVAQTMIEWSHARFQHELMSIERLLDQGDLQQALRQAQQLLVQCEQAGIKAYQDADYDWAEAQAVLGTVLKKGSAHAQALSYLQVAQQGFEALGEKGAYMSAVCLTEQGESFIALGRLDKAVETYEQAIQLGEQRESIRNVAVGKGELATVHMLQQRYDEALKGYREALNLFNQLNEPSSVATTWHQMAMVYKEQYQYTQAEQAYKQSLAISSQQNNKAGEALTLNELGNLYNKCGHLEQATLCYRQASDAYVALQDLLHEGYARTNLANTLRRLQRYNEARLELKRAIECNKDFGHVANPWITWNILYDLEIDCGNTQAAQDARQEAIKAYSTYRHDGGQTNIIVAQLTQLTLQAIQEHQFDDFLLMLQVLDTSTDDYGKMFNTKLKTILAGCRDKSLAEGEALDYDAVVEILLLLEQLDTLSL